MVTGDYRDPSPPSGIVHAVERGEIDVAIAWGPLAGYFARRATVPLRVTAVAQPQDGGTLPMAFDIAMGVRRDDAALREALDVVIRRRQGNIDRLLASYGVPMVR